MLEKKIVIFNDGIDGHLHQCQAVSFQVERLYREKGVPAENIVTEIINVKLRTRLAKTVVFLQTHLPEISWRLCMLCVRFAIKKKDYRNLMKTKADVFISAFGKRTVALNLLFKRKWSAKSVVVMNAGRAIKRFDLAVVHRHDQVEQYPNVVKTEGAPNIMTEDYVRSGAGKLIHLTGPLGNFRIGLLLGGNYKHFQMARETIAEIAEQMEDASERLGADILITTSRRTPRDVEQLLEERFLSHPNCKLLVIAGKKNIDGAVPGILGLSEVVIVSPESVSMVSEAASSGRHVLVYRLDEFLTSKHRLFITNMESKGYIKYVKINRISEHIDEFSRTKQKTRVLDDHRLIRQGLQKII